MTSPEVFVIAWKKSLPELRNYLDQCGGYLSVSAMFRWSSKERCLVETDDKTIVICEGPTVRRLEAAYPHLFGGRVNSYDWETFPSPNEAEGETHNLHISGIPNDFQEADAVAYVRRELSPILHDDDYDVDFKLRSRTTGEISGHGEITFKEGIDLYTIKLCKLMLHNKPLASKTEPGRRMMVRCVWFKPTPVRAPRDAEESDKGESSKGGWSKVSHSKKPSKPELSRKFVNVRPVKVDVSSLGSSSKPTTSTQ